MRPPNGRDISPAVAAIGTARTNAIVSAIWRELLPLMAGLEAWAGVCLVYGADCRVDVDRQVDHHLNVGVDSIDVGKGMEAALRVVADNDVASRRARRKGSCNSGNGPAPLHGKSAVLVSAQQEVEFSVGHADGKRPGGDLVHLLIAEGLCRPDPVRRPRQQHAKTAYNYECFH